MKKILPIVLSVFVSACASTEQSAQPASGEGYVPLGARAAMGEEVSPADTCRLEMQLANSVASLRDSGRSKEELAAGIEPVARVSPHRAALMAVLLEEAYGAPQIAKYPFYAYRSAVCLGRLANEQPRQLPEVEPAILQCQASHGVENTEPLTNCIFSAVSG